MRRIPFPKTKRQVHIVGLVCILVLTVIGGSYAVSVNRTLLATTEGLELADLFKAQLKTLGPEALPSPLSPEAAGTFSRLTDGLASSLPKSESILRLTIWTPEGSLAWTSSPGGESGDLLRRELPPRALAGNIVSRFEDAPGAPSGRGDKASGLVLENFTPVFPQTGPPAARPAFIAEIQSAPRAVIGHMRETERRIWISSAAIAIVSFAVLLFLLRMMGRHQESADARIRLEQIAGKIAKAINSSLEPRELLDTITRKILEAVPCDRFALDSQDLSSEFKHYIEHGDKTLGPPSDDPEYEETTPISAEVYRTLQPCYVPDLEQSPWTANRLTREGYRSALFIPLLQGRRCIAHMLLADRKPHAFSPAEQELLVSVADHLALALRNATLHQQSAERASRLEIASRIARAAGSELEPDAVFRAIAKELLQHVPCDRFVVGSYILGEHTYQYYYEEAQPPLGPPDPNENIPGTISTQVYRTKRFFYVPDLADSPWAGGRHLRLGFRCVLVVPILQADECIAHLFLSSKRLDAFTPSQIELLTSVADHLGPAIRNATLYRMAEERTSRLQIAGEISKVASSTLQPDEVFRIIVREIRRAVPCQRCVIASAKEGSPSFHYWLVESDIPLSGIPLDEETARWVIGNVYEKKSPLLSDNTEKPVPSARQLAEAGLLSTLFIPILQDERCIAHVALSSDRRNAFTNEHIELLSSIVSHVAPAIRNATLYQEAEKRASHLEIAAEIAKAVNSTLHPEEVFQTIVREIRRAVPCERCVIGSVDLETNHRHAWYFESDIPLEVRREGHDEQGRWWESAVYKKQQPVNHPDIREISHPRAAEMARSGLRSALVMPILQENRCIAHIFLASTRLNAFTPDHEDLLTYITHHLGTAIRNAALYRTAQERASLLQVADNISKVVGSTLEPQELFRAITREIRRVVSCERCSIATIDGRRFQMIERFTDSEIEVPPVSPKENEETSRRLYNKVYLPRCPLYCHDILKERGADDRLAKAGFRSSLSVPILQGDTCIAHLMVASVQPDYFTLEHAELLSNAASHIGPAMRNATLYREAQKRATRMAALNELERQLSENLNLSEVLNGITRAAAELLGGDHSRLFLVDEGRQELVIQAWCGHLTSSGEPSTRFRIGEGIIGQVAESGRSVNLGDIQSEPQWVTKDWAQSHQVHSYIARPLVQGEKVIGALNCFSQEKDFFSEEDMLLLEALASQSVIAIQNARLHEDTLAHLAELESLEQAAKALTSELQLADLLERIADISLNLLGADRCALLVRSRESGKLEPLYARGISRGYLDMLAENSNLILPGEAASKKNPIVVENVEQGTPGFLPPSEAVPEGFQSLVISPLVYKKVAFGALSLYWNAARKFTRNDVNLVQAFADHAAIAIQNARLHEAERRSRQFLNSVIGDTADPIVIVDLNRQITLWNMGAQSLYGFSEAEILGCHVNVLIPEEERQRTDDYISQLFEIPRPVTFETRRRRKDGGVLPVSMTLSPVKNEDGALVAIASIHKDLTAQKKAEEEIQQAKTEAEMANRAKSEFLLNMSHELRSPLNAVIGFSDILLMTTQEEETRQTTDKIRDAGEYLLKLIEDLLDLDRIASGKIHLDMQSIPINTIIQSEVDNRIPYLPPEFTLHSQLDEECGNVFADPTRIQQLLINLLDNAVKYSPEGGTIEVRTKWVRGGAWISVRDEGLGISPEDFERIFERFHQTESGLSRRAGGLGIGLHLAKQIIELHGGRIWVENNETQGSTFTFSLPESEANVPPTPRSEVGAPSVPPMPWSGTKILVIDDAIHYQNYMKSLLEGATIFQAGNGREGFELASRELPDLILVDLRMPVMDGFEAIERLKGHPATAEIPIIAVSGTGMEADKKRALQMGASSFVSKPADVVTLQKEIARVLESIRL